MKTIFKKGDKVWSFSMQEWGVVDDTEDKRDPTYPVTASFEAAGEQLSYTEDGRTWAWDKAPDLYFHKVLAPDQKKERPLKHKDIVMCWNNGAEFERVYRFYNQKQKRTFSPYGTVNRYAYENMLYVPDEEAPQDLLSMRDKLIED